jgi:hypothetical protein
MGVRSNSGRSKSFARLVAQVRSIEATRGERLFAPLADGSPQLRIEPASGEGRFYRLLGKVADSERRAVLEAATKWGPLGLMPDLTRAEAERRLASLRAALEERTEHPTEVHRPRELGAEVDLTANMTDGDLMGMSRDYLRTMYKTHVASNPKLMRALGGHDSRDPSDVVLELWRDEIDALDRERLVIVDQLAGRWSPGSGVAALFDATAVPGRAGRERARYVGLALISRSHDVDPVAAWGGLVILASLLVAEEDDLALIVRDEGPREWLHLIRISRAFGMVTDALSLFTVTKHQHASLGEALRSLAGELAPILRANAVDLIRDADPRDAEEVRHRLLTVLGFLMERAGSAVRPPLGTLVGAEARSLWSIHDAVADRSVPKRCAEEHCANYAEPGHKKCSRHLKEPVRRRQQRLREKRQADDSPERR